MNLKTSAKCTRTIISSLDRVIINISGEVYETDVKTLEKFPKTLLGNHQKRSIYYCGPTGCYFFDRSRLFFDAILFFYQSNGILQCPPEMPICLFEDECRFFELPEEAIKKLQNHQPFEEEEETEEQYVEPQQDLKLRARIWNLMHNMESSRAAKLFTIFSILMITVSVASICLETLPMLRCDPETILDDPWHILDLSLNAWFLLELSVTVACAPDLKLYLKRVMSWVEIIAVVPYFITLTLSGGHISAIGFIRIVRLCRVFRLFISISKQSKMLKDLAVILQDSVEEFKTLLICFTMIIVLGGSFVYFLEAGVDGNMFTDIPTSVYWATVTITTVGYGDYYPVSYQGQIWASLYIFFGALTLCIPIMSVIAKLEALVDNKGSSECEENYDFMNQIKET